jgi:hypothetical protein
METKVKKVLPEDMGSRELEIIADSIYNWVGQACYDLAQGEAMDFDGKKKVRRAGGIDCYAEKLYADAATMRDLIGDRIHGEAVGNLDKMIAIAGVLRADCNDTASIRKACTSLIKGWKMWKSKVAI